MTVVMDTISETEVRASIQRVISHAESIWDEWAWQVENKTWLVLNYSSWDEMRRAEYSAVTSVTAPRAERPELVARFRNAGLTQKQTAETLGIHQATVSRLDPIDNTGTGRPVMHLHNDAIGHARVAESSPTHSVTQVRPRLTDEEWAEQQHQAALERTIRDDLGYISDAIQFLDGGLSASRIFVRECMPHHDKYLSGPRAITAERLDAAMEFIQNLRKAIA